MSKLKQIKRCKTYENDKVQFVKCNNCSFNTSEGITK